MESFRAAADQQEQAHLEKHKANSARITELELLQRSLEDERNSLQQQVDSLKLEVTRTNNILQLERDKTSKKLAEKELQAEQQQQESRKRNTLLLEQVEQLQQLQDLHKQQQQQQQEQARQEAQRLAEVKARAREALLTAKRDNQLESIAAGLDRAGGEDKPSANYLRSENDLQMRVAQQQESPPVTEHGVATDQTASKTISDLQGQLATLQTKYNAVTEQLTAASNHATTIERQFREELAAANLRLQPASSSRQSVRQVEPDTSEMAATIADLRRQVQFSRHRNSELEKELDMLKQPEVWSHQSEQSNWEGSFFGEVLYCVKFHTIINYYLLKLTKLWFQLSVLKFTLRSLGHWQGVLILSSLLLRTVIATQLRFCLSP